jgi:hypothetical protein
MNIRASKLVAVIAVVVAAMSPLGAQGFKITQPPPNCRILDKRLDNPYDDTHHYLQPRMAWHAEYATASLLTGFALRKWTRLPNWVIGIAPTFAFGIAPHVRGGIIKRSYPINPLDWAFDAWTRAGPSFWIVAHRDDSTDVVWKHHAVATGIFLAGYAALACYSSP